MLPLMLFACVNQTSQCGNSSECIRKLRLPHRLAREAASHRGGEATNGRTEGSLSRTNHRSVRYTATYRYTEELQRKSKKHFMVALV